MKNKGTIKKIKNEPSINVHLYTIKKIDECEICEEFDTYNEMRAFIRGFFHAKKHFKGGR